MGRIAPGSNGGPLKNPTKKIRIAFQANDTITPTDKWAEVYAIVLGGGEGGEGGRSAIDANKHASGSGRGGSAGGYAEGPIAFTPGVAIPITVGVAGVGGAGGGPNTGNNTWSSTPDAAGGLGTAGGTSSVGTQISATGGSASGPGVGYGGIVNRTGGLGGIRALYASTALSNGGGPGGGGGGSAGNRHTNGYRGGNGAQRSSSGQASTNPTSGGGGAGNGGPGVDATPGGTLINLGGPSLVNQATVARTYFDEFFDPNASFSVAVTTADANTVYGEGQGSAGLYGNVASSSDLAGVAKPAGKFAGGGGGAGAANTANGSTGPSGQKGSDGSFGCGGGGGGGGGSNASQGYYGQGGRGGNGGPGLVLLEITMGV